MAEDTNTTSYGKDGWSLMQCGNLPHVLKMVQKKYSKNIDTDFNDKQTHDHAQQGNPNNYLYIPRRRSGRPSYPGPNHSIYSSNSTTTSHITTHSPESIYNVQRCSSIRRYFHCSSILATTYPTSSHFFWIDIPPVKKFSSKFTHHPSWATNSMYCLIHWLGQQNAIQLHRTKKVSIPSWLWIMVWLCPQTQMGLYLQFWLSRRQVCIKVKMNNLKTPTNSEHEWSIATKEHPLSSHVPKSFINTLLTPKILSLSLLFAENMLVFIGPLQKRFPIRTPLGRQQPLPISWPNLVNDSPTHSLHNWLNLTCLNTLLTIPSGSYQQEYHTIVINTPISRPTPITASDGKSCPPFIKPSFLQSSSPVSNSSPISVPPTVPSPIDSAHQHELFKWLWNLPIQGYPTKGVAEWGSWTKGWRGEGLAKGWKKKVTSPILMVKVAIDMPKGTLDGSPGVQDAFELL